MKRGQAPSCIALDACCTYWDSTQAGAHAANWGVKIAENTEDVWEQASMVRFYWFMFYFLGQFARVVHMLQHWNCGHFILSPLHDTIQFKPAEFHVSCCGDTTFQSQKRGYDTGNWLLTVAATCPPVCTGLYGLISCPRSKATKLILQTVDIYSVMSWVGA